MLQRTGIIILLSLLLLPFALQAQSFGTHRIRPGSSSDSLLALLRGEYTTIDTVSSAESHALRSIRLAPVRLAGLDGLLIVDLDSTGSIVEVRWSRQIAEMYLRRGVWATFTGWNDWTTPTREETERVSRQLMQVYGPVDTYAEAMMRPDTPPLIMGRQWEHEGAKVYINHSGTMLLARINPVGFPVDSRR
jgi:hypothetical protein